MVHGTGAKWMVGVVVAWAGAWAQAQAQPQTPPDLSDLVGARGAGAETQMQARGYELARATKVRDQSWTFWWNGARRACVAVATADGRYASIQSVPDENCAPGGRRDSARSDAPQPPPPRPSERALTLVCYGQGEHATVTSHPGYEWDDKRRRYESRTQLESGKEQFQTGVQFDFRGDSGRVHLTGALVPPIHSGGTDGWWPLEDVQITPDRITAHYRFNALSKPRVEIDRHSGLVEIKGSPGFTGQCDQGDWGAGRRF